MPRGRLVCVWKKYCDVAGRGGGECSNLKKLMLKDYDGNISNCDLRDEMKIQNLLAALLLLAY